MTLALRFVAAAALAITTAVAGAQAATPAVAPQTGVATGAGTGNASWVASWGASQQIPEPQNALPADDLRDATLRQIVHLSTGGSALRVHLSNAFGTEALHLNSVHVARPLSTTSPAIDPASDHPLTFFGKPDVTIPPGAEIVSDPLEFPVKPLSDLAISFHFDEPPSRQTGHPGSRATSYYVPGDRVSSPDLSPQASAGSNGVLTVGDCKEVSASDNGKPEAAPCRPRPVEHWYQISGVDVLATPGAASVVALGDSITDGHGATTNGNDRWTDVLARRLQASPATQNIGVSNQGIGGNHLLTDGLGPNALARFDRDVLAPAGVRWVIVFEGVNDLGALARTEEPPSETRKPPLAELLRSAQAHTALTNQIIAAYEQIIARAHAHGLRVYGATITPYAGSSYYHPGPASEADRQAINKWIRAPGHFDAVLDFDAVVRDPWHPDTLREAFDSGDHLHPSPAGYKAMGDAVSLELFSH